MRLDQITATLDPSLDRYYTLALPWERARIDRLVDDVPDLATFIRAAWHVLEPETPLVWGWHLDAFCEHLTAIVDGQVQKLIINCPPSMSKSRIISVMFPAWAWTFRPALRFLTGSYVAALSIRDALASRRLIVSDWYQARWGRIFALTGDVNAKQRYENNQTGLRVAVMVGGATGEKGDVRILDDPHNVNDILSETTRQTVTDWYRNTWSQRGNQADSPEVVIMQRLSKGDLTDFLLTEIGGFEHLNLAMRFEADRRCVTSIGFADPRLHDGDLLCPTRFDDAAVQAKEKTLGPRHAPGQLQQRPVARGGTVIRRDWFEIVPAAPVGGVSVRGWDLGGSVDGNPTAGVKLRWVEGIWYVEHVVTRQAPTHDVERLLKITANQDGPDTEQSLPQDPGQAGQAQAQYLIGQLVGYRVHASPESGAKDTRFEAFASQAAAGNVKLVEGPWNGAYLDELELLWAGDRDDQADATSRAFHRILAGSKVGWYDEVA